MKKIVITGGSGFIGTHLINLLLSKKYTIVNVDLVPSRVQSEKIKNITLNIATDTIPQEIFEDCIAAINLAGVPIFGRFTKKYKEKIYNSRIITTRKLVETFSLVAVKPQVFISASAIGYYGDKQGTVATEDVVAGTDFLAHVCVDWEKEALVSNTLGVRTVIFRNAHVLGQGGLARVLVQLFKKRLGGYFGKGNQYMPWVSVSDICAMYLFAIENTKLQGVYNTAVSNPTQKEFMKDIALSVGVSLVWSIPLFAARLLYGSFVDSLASSVFVDTSKIKKIGFIFRDTEILKLSL